MALSVVDLYRDILPKTNCKDCGYPTCLAFASMVVSEKLPLENCPYLDPETLARCTKELEAQYAEGKWLKRYLFTFIWRKVGNHNPRADGRGLLNFPIQSQR